MKHGSDARLVDMVVEALLQGNMGDRRIIIRRDDEVETKGSMWIAEAVIEIGEWTNTPLERRESVQFVKS